MKINNVTIAGAGTLGSQIAFQSALCGHKVKIWNPHPDKAIERISALRPFYKKDVHITDDEFDDAVNRIVSITDDFKVAFQDTDLVIEAIPEDLQLKEDFYRKLIKVLPEESIIASNSSTFIPSQLVKYVDHPERFLHLHFANHIWKFNTAEIMTTEHTSETVIKSVIEFSKNIKMLPIVLKKEQHGYIMNSLSIPFLNAALELWAKGVADPITIDKDWMNSTGSPMGPFMAMDMIGLRTVLAIYSSHADSSGAQIIINKLKALVDQGKYGIESNEGFYTYPDPAFNDPDFLK